MQTRDTKSDVFQLIMMGVTFVLLTVTGVTFHQPLVRILPLYISLVVMLLFARVSRYSYLLGACNSLLYGYVYYCFGLYAQVFYAVLISSPIQFVSFFLWGKRPWGQSTILKRLSVKQRGKVIVLFVAVWFAVMAVLNALGSNYQMLDTSITLLGILSSILTMLAYVEYAYLVLPSSILNIILYALMLLEDPAQSTYLVYNVYCLICQIMSLQRVRKLYRLQQNHAAQSK